MSIGVKIGFGEDDDSLVMCILDIETASFSEDDEGRTVAIECVGNFTIKGFNSIDNKKRVEKIKPVAMSTLYPFIRTYVFNLTNLDAKEPPIILPIVNLANMG